MQYAPFNLFKHDREWHGQNDRVQTFCTSATGRNFPLTPMTFTLEFQQQRKRKIFHIFRKTVPYFHAIIADNLLHFLSQGSVKSDMFKDLYKNVAEKSLHYPHQSGQDLPISCQKWEPQTLAWACPVQQA